MQEKVDATGAADVRRTFARATHEESVEQRVEEELEELVVSDWVDRLPESQRALEERHARTARKRRRPEASMM